MPFKKLNPWCPDYGFSFISLDWSVSVFLADVVTATASCVSVLAACLHLSDLQFKEGVLHFHLSCGVYACPPSLPPFLIGNRTDSCGGLRECRERGPRSTRAGPVRSQEKS